MSADRIAHIEAFAVDGPEPPPLPFAARLARENGWPRPFAERVVREYLRFMALAVTAGRPVCPSDAVDEAWHLHLTYTRSYWKHFCGETLGRPVHHDPTRGGPAEAAKHRAMYADTLEAYRRTFGHAPPSDIWPPVDERFADPARFVRVDRAETWTVPKRRVKRAAGAVLATAVALMFGTGCVGGLNPFELVGVQFLGFLIPVMIAAAALGRVVRDANRGAKPQPGDDELTFDWQQTAYLAGGTPRLATAAISRLVARGAARLSDDGKRLEPTGPVPKGLSAVEDAVFEHLPLKGERDDLKKVNDAVEARFTEPAAALTEDGFLLKREQLFGMRLAALAPVLLVLLFAGVPRLVMGLMNGKPVGYLVVTLGVGGVIAAVAAVAGNERLTRRGSGVMAGLQARHAGLKSAEPADPDAAALAVALFGTAALAGPTFLALTAWYPRTPAGDGSGCSTGCGSDGGGGGCGSGCGGCGGGGD